MPCVAFGFRNVHGKLQGAGCLKALREFERAGRIVLPAPLICGGTSTPRTRAAKVPLAQSVPDVIGALHDLDLSTSGPARRRTNPDRRASIKHNPSHHD